MKTHESLETYLETILMLGKSRGSVRAVDIAGELDYSRPSVSVAMKNLREKGLIMTSAEGFISLTEAGLEIAESMYERHVFISDWLISLGVCKEIAENDACKIEHVMSMESFIALKKYITKE